MHALRVSTIMLSLLVVLPSIVKAQGNRPSGLAGRLGDLQIQIDDNADAIESLEQKTTLSDLPCSTDEIAKFDGTAWVCAPQPDNSLADITAALCLKAERDGDTVRPLVCDPRCDCFQTQLAQGVVTSCTEVAPGDITAELVETREERCLSGRCENSSLDSCTCESCTEPGLPFPFPCNCTECPNGEFCRTTVMFPTMGPGTCVRGCSSSADCPTSDFDVTLTLSNVGESGSTEIAQCSCDGAQCNPPLDINSIDAAVCLSAIEASLGSTCTD